MKYIILSVSNDIVSDQRIHKVASYLHQLHYEVTIVGRRFSHSLPLDRPYKTRRFRLFFNKGALFYACFNIRLFFHLLFSKVDLLISNDLDTLAANYLVAGIRRKKLVYDTHEFFTGVPEIQHRPFVKKTWEMIEGLIFPRLQHIMTVNPSIARLYEEKYHKKLYVVRNISPSPDPALYELPPPDNLPKDKKMIILQGSGINMDRGAEEAVLAMKGVEEAVLFIIGGGEVIPTLKEMVKKELLENKVVFKACVPYLNLLNYTRHAFLGLSMDKDTNINYRFSLPNKIFDYIQCRVPVLCSNLIEVKQIIEGYRLGRVAQNHDPAYLASLINEIIRDTEAYEAWKKNLDNAAKELCWENEVKKLHEFYTPILQKG